MLSPPSIDPEALFGVREQPDGRSRSELSLAKLIIYYAHPGHKYSHVNSRMADIAAVTSGVTFVDLYAEYPRFDINIDLEQQRLLDHDVILFQFPMFWYSTPSLIKEWEDLVLEHGFAYGHDGTRLTGKRMLLAVSAAGPAEAYTRDGYQHYPIRTFLTPLEQTARLCKMEFSPPYVLYGSLQAPEDGRLEAHVAGYRRLLEAIRDDEYDFDAVADRDTVDAASLPLREAAA